MAMVSIRAEALRKHFGDLVAVDDVSFEVEQGENFALLGPNGAGKSTLIRMLTTLLLPTRGRAWVAGHDVRSQPDLVRRAIGVVPQAITSDPKLTAAENLEFCARLHGIPKARRAALTEELLDWVSLSEWRNKLVGTFSGGMRRRVEIARSLVHKPGILFLDEPTTGLDPASRVALWEMLRSMKERQAVTVFLTTHYMEEAEEACDRVAIVDHGKLIVQGTPTELKAMVPAAQTIEVSFSTAPGGWGALLENLPAVDRVSGQNGVWRLECRDRAQALGALLEATREHGVGIQWLNLERSTLQDVFIHFTGRDLRDAASKLRLDSRLVYQG